MIDEPIVPTVAEENAVKPPAAEELGTEEVVDASENTLCKPFFAEPSRRLACKNIAEDTFNYVLRTANSYEMPEDVVAGVVPHHLTAAPMIGGFFLALAKETVFDTVVLVGPNHAGDVGDVIVSFCDWEGNGVARCDTALLQPLLDVPLRNGLVVAHDDRMETEHSVSTLVPFVQQTWPDAAVAPVLVSRSLTYADVIAVAEQLTQTIIESGKRVLLLCSIDFSHDLSPAEAELRDLETMGAVQRSDLRTIYQFTNAHVDSPASLMIFLTYLHASGAKPLVVDHADASLFLDNTRETTSYFVLAGCRE